MKLIRISFRELCFAVEVSDGIVVFAAPCARWMEGRAWTYCRDYWTKRGAEVLELG